MRQSRPLQCRGIKRSCEIELSEKSIAMTKLQVYMNGLD